MVQRCDKNVAVLPPQREPARLRRIATWSGLRAGDRVEVDDPRARRATFEFVAHPRATRSTFEFVALVENLVSGDSWVEVVGGKRGDRKLWSFRPEQIFAPGAKGRGPSLAAAPRLDLD